WPVSTRSITACFNTREAVAIEDWRRVRNCEAQPNTNSFIEPGRDGFVGNRGCNRQPPGRALRRGGAERVPRLRGALRRDHAAGARSFSGARLARQLQRRGRETASLFAGARWPNESRRKLVGCAFA